VDSAAPATFFPVERSFVSFLKLEKPFLVQRNSFYEKILIFAQNLTKRNFNFPNSI